MADENVFHVNFEGRMRLGGLIIPPPKETVESAYRKSGFLKAVVGKRDSEENFLVAVPDKTNKLYVTLLEDIPAGASSNVIEVDVDVIPLKKYRVYGFPIWIHSSFLFSMDRTGE